MRKGIIFALLFTAPVMVQAGVYTCEVGGKKVFQSTPCAVFDEGSHKRIDASDAARMNPSAEASPRKKIDFGTTPVSKLTVAVAVLESLELDGRDCDWALKVDRSKAMACSEFAHRVENEFDQTLDVLKELIKENPRFYDQNYSQFNKAKRASERILQYITFARVELLGN